MDRHAKRREEEKLRGSRPRGRRSDVVWATDFVNDGWR